MKQLMMNSGVVTGTPMTRGEYCIFRGWPLPINEDGTDEGMLINFAHHSAWWPKESISTYFSEVPENVPEWQAQVTREHNQQVVKAQKLREFLASDKFLSLAPAEQLRLTRQYTAMGQYIQVLGERMDGWGE